jgi:hypothetical protein
MGRWLPTWQSYPGSWFRDVLHREGDHRMVDTLSQWRLVSKRWIADPTHLVTRCFSVLQISRTKTVPSLDCSCHWLVFPHVAPDTLNNEQAREGSYPIPLLVVTKLLVMKENRLHIIIAKDEGHLRLNRGSITRSTLNAHFHQNIHFLSPSTMMKKTEIYSNTLRWEVIMDHQETRIKKS